MLRQYYAARSAAAANGLGPDANWALKERRDAIPSPHVHPMSTRILGVGILLAGVLVLSVALIMGLEFPKYVHTHLREDQCVLQDQHDKFRTWVSLQSL
ncbi:hypothetical protein BaRGS_00004560 [Batillaria attramentaria]|uniref:Uncharacterized protein n=1 Tax=Batillaria attramentaria TaxID=370345 RepID=A0ABD0LYK3_9CAEN